MSAQMPTDGMGVDRIACEDFMFDTTSCAASGSAWCQPHGLAGDGVHRSAMGPPAEAVGATRSDTVPRFGRPHAGAGR